MAVETPNRVEIAERMSAADFYEFAPDTKAELIDGVMVVLMPPLDIHESLFNFLYRLLGDYVDDHNLGIVRGSRTSVELDEDQVYEPDILFVAQARREIVQRKGVVGAPDLVIEILSASTAAHDRGAKLRGYERAGVSELWLIDPYGAVGTTFYQREAGRYTLIQPNERGKIFSRTILGFWINTAWLWPKDRFIAVRQALAEIEQNTQNP